MLRESGVDLDLNQTLKELEEEMLAAANNLEFEKAALLRDQIRELKRSFGHAGQPVQTTPAKHASAVSYGPSGKRTPPRRREKRGRRMAEPF